MGENVLARSWALSRVETMNSVDPARVSAPQGQCEEKPQSMRESGLNQRVSTDWRRGESNPHLRIANAPSSH